MRGDSAERNLVLSFFPYIKRNILLQRTAQSVSVCITVRSRDFSIERTPNFRKSFHSSPIVSPSMDVEGTILNLLSTSNRPFNVQV